MMLLRDDNLFWHSISSKICSTKGLKDGSFAFTSRRMALLVVVIAITTLKSKKRFTLTVLKRGIIQERLQTRLSNWIDHLWLIFNTIA